MHRRHLFALLTLPAFTALTAHALAADTATVATRSASPTPTGVPMTNASRSAHAFVNGVSLYYEIHGSGRPLVLLHGGVQASEAFGPNLAALAAKRQVIAVHLRGHGHTPDVDRPLRFEDLADDVAALAADLGLKKVDVMGYSLGGGVAQQVAIRHPDLVDRLVVVSQVFKRAGWYPEVIAAFDTMAAHAPTIAQNIAQSPMAKVYPDVKWEALLRKIAELESRDYDWTAQLAGVKARTLLVFADADAMRPEHMVEFYKLLGGGRQDAGMDGSTRPASQWAVVPNATHYNLLTTDAVAKVVSAFLDR